MGEVWIEVSFDDQPMDNIIVDSIREAGELIVVIEDNGFAEYNEEIKDEWLEMGFRDNPDVTVKIIANY